MANKKVAAVSLTELLKRCPPNQVNEFKEFMAKTNEYSERVNKYPASLPKIDWEFYRKNVRSEYVNLVDDFEKKYESLSKMFESRIDIDTSKYYADYKKLYAEVQGDIKEFNAASDKRIKAYEAEIECLRAQLPFNEMTMEEWCEVAPEHPLKFNGQPSFWPHTPEEQKLGPVGVPHVKDAHTKDAHTKDADTKKTEESNIATAAVSKKEKKKEPELGKMDVPKK